MSQLMQTIKALLILILASLLLSFSAHTKTVAQLAQSLPAYSKVYDETRNPFNDATAAIALAQASQRNVIIEIGGNWCTWCHKMDAFLEQNPDIYQTLHKNYVLLKINVSDANENEAFMKSLPPVLGYPHMYVSTSSGKMMLSKDTAELLAGDNYSRTEWIAFLERWHINNNPENLQKLNVP